MKTTLLPRLWLACALLTGTSVTACTRKSAANTPINLAIKFPELPPRLTGSSWLAPFQLNLLIEGANGYVHKQAITADTTLDLNVPTGALRIRANYFGVELPAGASGTMLCSDGNDGGSGPMGLYIATSDQTVSVNAAAEFTVAFGNLQAANEIRFGATLKYADETAASNAVLTYLDSLTGLPIEGPCGAGENSPRDTADSSGRIVAKYFAGNENTILPTLVTHNGTAIPVTFTISPANPTENFFAVNLSNKTVTTVGASGDFDGDGLPNSSDPDPYCGPSFCGDNSGGGGGDGGGGGGGFQVNTWDVSPQLESKASVNANISVGFSQTPNTTSLAGKIKIYDVLTNAEVPCGPFNLMHSRVFCKPAALAANKMYRVEVSSGITSTSGSTLDTGMNWTFATGPNFSIPLSVNFAWPNAKDDAQVSPNANIGVKFNQPLNISQNFSSVVQIIDTTTNTPVPASCDSYYEKSNSEAEVNCYPTTPLTAGKRYAIKVAPSIMSSTGGTLANEFRSEFTVYNSSVAEPTPVALRKIPDGNAVRQDTVFGVFFSKPVRMDTWNLLPSGKFSVKDSINTAVMLNGCEPINDLNGFLCRGQGILPEGVYTAKLLAGSVIDGKGQANTEVTWNFTVVATDTSQFARILEHPVSGTVPNLNKITTLTVYNRPINTDNNTYAYASATPYPMGTPEPSNSYRGTMMHSENGPLAYIATIKQLFSAGDFSFTHSGIRDSSQTTSTPPPTASPSPTPSPTPQMWSATLAAPTLDVAETFPMQGETVSVYAPIVLSFNKPVAGDEATLKPYIKVNGVQLSMSADYTMELSGYTVTGKIKITRNGPFAAGSTVTVELLTGAGSPFAEMGGATRTLTFSTHATEPPSFVTAHSHNSEVVWNRDAISTSVLVSFNKLIDISAIKLDACEVVNSTCGTSIATNLSGSLAYPSSFSTQSNVNWYISGGTNVFQNEKTYRFTVTGAKELNGNNIASFTWDMKRVYGFTAGTLTYPATNWVSANQPVNIEPLVFVGGASYGISCQSGVGGLPAGLSVDPNTCAITGTPTYPTAEATYYIHWHDDGGCREDPVTIGVAGINGSPTAYFTNNAPGNWTPYGFIFPAGTNSCTITPTLPAGLVISNTCTITGTPTTVSAPMNYTITVTNTALTNPVIFTPLTIQVN